ncbi:hypothetical protein V8E53_010431 [Lactarius tabidus]
MPKNPAKRARSSGSTNIPAHYVPTDVEDEPDSNVQVGNVPPNCVRKLKRSVSRVSCLFRRPAMLLTPATLLPLQILVCSPPAETYIEDEDYSSDDSTMATENGGTDSVSTDDEEGDNLVRLTQNVRLSQKMAIERPFWPTGASNTMDIDRDNVKQHRLVPNNVYSAGVASDDVSMQVDTPFDGHHVADSSYRGTRTIHASHSEDRRANHARSKGPQVTHARSKGHQATESRFMGAMSGGNRSAHTDSEDQRVMCADSKHHQATLTDPESPQVTEPVLAATVSNNNQVSRTGSVNPLWPVETDLRLSSSGRIKLTDQNTIMRKAISDAFTVLHSSIIFHHAFPDAVLTATFVRQALLTVTSRMPYSSGKEIRKCILIDHEYYSTMSILPRARISIFCAEVKERCVAAVMLVVDTHHSPVELANIIDGQMNDFNYIFPRQLRGNVLTGSALRSRPYRSSIIISVIRDIFFTGPVPFATQHRDLFPSHPGPVGEAIPEVPKAMLALVSTAYYAALNEWRTGERKPLGFTANMYIDAYNSHINSLDKMERVRNTSFHTMMANIYLLALNRSPRSEQPLSPPTLDLSTLEDE